MGTAFFRQGEASLSPILMGGIPMLSSVLGMLGRSSGDLLPQLTRMLEEMGPELLETLVKQLSTSKPERSEYNG